ncbi:hypothetical protein B0T16DRAFT_461449 [Cercophora newfieldiana]|uniref:Uncharacterized protein n=1 Tax=Cercophora newfieldiana TaxID=92897 RepID=A0AA40CJN9_9PEZI|nr:hypothetical protein B0T16DRAFT_461449 [Cercophora newfieldiana]
MTPEYPIKQFFDKITAAWGTFGADLRVGPKLEGMMRAAGFVNVETKRFKLPIGVWSQDAREKELGVSFQMVIKGALEALCGAIATVEGWSKGERVEFTERCDRAI